MSSTRRALILIGLTFAVLIGGSVSASATFSESVALTTTTVATATIAPPTQVEAYAICTTTVDPVTLVSTTTTEVKIEWWQSTSPRVTGYRVTAHPASGAPYTVRTTGPTDEIFVPGDAKLLAPGMKISVTTLTSSTWTAESAKTPVQKC